MAPQIKHNWESIHPNILSKWVWICSPYPPYTATWYNTPVSCCQIAMSPQNVLYVHSVCSASVVIFHPAPQYRFQTSLSEWSDVLQRKTMDCFSSIFFLSFQDFYTIVLDELVLKVAARHRDDINNVASYCCWLFAFTAKLVYKIVNKQSG
jgi:hypothetical protein